MSNSHKASMALLPLVMGQLVSQDWIVYVIVSSY